MPDIELNGASEATVLPIRESLNASKKNLPTFYNLYGDISSGAVTYSIETQGRFAEVYLEADLELSINEIPVGESYIHVLQDDAGGHDVDITVYVGVNSYSFNLNGSIDGDAYSSSIIKVINFGQSQIDSSTQIFVSIETGYSYQLPLPPPPP